MHAVRALALLLSVLVPGPFALAQAPAGDLALGFQNGPDWVPLRVDGSRLGVRFDPRLDEAAVRARIAEMPAVADGEALRARFAAGATVVITTAPGTGPAAALEAAARIRALPGVLSAASPQLFALEDPYYLTEEVLVRWERGTDPAVIESLTRGWTATAQLGYAVNPGVVYRVPAGADPLQEANRIAWSGHAEFAIPDFQLTRVPLRSVNDPLLSRQWHLESTGQFGAGVDEDIDAFDAWNVTMGDPSVTVAIIDTGVELLHPDLVANLVQGIDVLGDDNDPRAENGWLGLFPENHSTSVHGVVAAEADNAQGVAGVAPGCTLMPIRFLSEFIFPAPTVQDEADAFNFACSNGAAVINNSWGPLGAAPLPASTRAAMDNCVENGRGGLGAVIFFAAGNSNSNNSGNGYAAYERTLSVTAVTDQGVKAGYSSFGPRNDLCAPSNGGVNGIATTDRLGSTGYSSNDYTFDFGGTSSASPCAAGVAALVISANPGLTWLEVSSILRATAEKVDPAGGSYDSLGHSDLYGYGRVNAHQAVLAALGGVTKDTITLSGDTSGVVGGTVSYTFANAPALAGWVLYASFNTRGSLVGTQLFDLGNPLKSVASGTTGPIGTGSWTSSPLPPSVQGRTVHLELGAFEPGAVTDSNPLALTVN